MSLGGFTAYVRCTRFEVSGGLHGAEHRLNEPYLASEMELEGKFSEFHYKELEKGLPNKIHPKANVLIEFTERQELEPYYSSREHPFIGSMRYWQAEKDTDNTVVTVKVTLPISMVPLLHSMRNDFIKFETIHEIINEPTKRQQVDHVVALVKRVYFEAAAEKQSEQSELHAVERGDSIFRMLATIQKLLIVLLGLIIVLIFWRS